MKEFTYVITEEVGIHARPAGLLVKAAKEMESEGVIIANGKEANIKKLMAILMLGVKKDDKITVRVTGENEEMDAQKLEDYFKKNL